MAEINKREDETAGVPDAKGIIGYAQQEMAMEGVDSKVLEDLLSIKKRFESGEISSAQVRELILGAEGGNVEQADVPEKNAEQKEEARQAIGFARYAMAIEGISGHPAEELADIANKLESGELSPEEVKTKLGVNTVKTEPQLAEPKAESKFKPESKPEPAAQEVEKLLVDIMYQMSKRGAKPKEIDAVLDIFSSLKKGEIPPGVAESRASEFGE